MAQIVSLLNGENINQDHQITALHKALINPGVISGLAVTAGQVAVGEAFVECNRSNGEKIMVHFQNTAPVNIDTSGNKKIFVEIKQANIDNGIINAEDGSNIGEIKSAANYPTKNYISLASVTGGTITDDRKFMGRKIPDVRGQGRKPKDYNSQTFYGPEFIEGSTIGISGVSWLNLHTYSAWKNDEHQYIKQLAITANGTMGIWIRGATSLESWGEWQQVFPFSATALDINGLTETNVAHNYNFFPVTEWGGGNKKVTLEVLKKWILPNNGKNFSHGNLHRNATTSQNYAIPNGGLAHVVYTGASRTQGIVRIMYSNNNSAWSKWYEYTTMDFGSVNFSCLLPPGFVRFEFSGSDTGALFSLQTF